MQRTAITLSVLFLLMITGCTAPQDGTLQGSVTPPSSGARITVTQLDRQIAVLDVGGKDGVFRVQLPPGTYAVSAISPSSPYPLRLDGIVIQTKQITVLPPFALGTAHGSATIRGTAYVSGGPVRVTLVADGIERASIVSTTAGAFAFEELPAGTYLVRVEAQGYVPGAVKAAVADGRQTVITVRMLYRTAIDGLDGNTGTLRVRGIGLPPQQAPTPSVRREMAKRAARADAERNLLKAIQMIQLGPSEKLVDVLGPRNTIERLQGYVQGARVVAERDLDGGRMEVELELALAGPDGLLASLE